MSIRLLSQQSSSTLPVSLAATWITRNKARIAPISSHRVPRGINAVIVDLFNNKKKKGISNTETNAF